jgi:NifU-like protein involved in Fe-S cluster formation
MSEKWALFHLHEDATLECTSCNRDLCGQTVHLYINVDDEIEDVMCDMCWKKNQKETNKP